MIINLVLVALMLTHAAPTETASPAVRGMVTPARCRIAGARRCTLSAVVVANSDEGLCTDLVMPSDQFMVDGTQRFGFITRAALVANHATPETASPTSQGTGETALLVTMNSGEPARLCIPLHIEIDGQGFRIAADDRASVFPRLSGSMLGGIFSKGSRVVQGPDGVQPYLRGPSSAGLSAVRTLGDYLFGTGTSSLVPVTVTSDRPKLLLLDGIVRGRTNLTFQIARGSLARLLVRDGERLLPLRSCRQRFTDRQEYAC